MHGESKRPHTHDVRTLAVASTSGAEPVLISAGNDAQILAHSVPRFVQACSVASQSLSCHALGCTDAWPDCLNICVLCRLCTRITVLSSCSF